jgi:hypothetical protein
MIYDTWKRTVKAKLSQEELAMAEEAAKKRSKKLTWGPLFQQERTYFPYKTATQQPLEVPQEIQAFLDSIGFEVVDYRQGLAKKKVKNQPIGIGKILNRENRQDLKKLFDDRLQGQAKQYNENLLVVFSHKPEDIAGSSTDRNWKSCVDLRGGEHHEQVFNKIERGGLVAYLIKESDKNIEAPLARVAIRRYGDNNGNFIFVGSNECYGIQDNNFVEFVNSKLAESNKITATILDLQDFALEDVEKGYHDIFPEGIFAFDYISKYGDFIPKEQIIKLQDQIIKSKDEEFIFYFAKNVKGADISKLQKAIIKTGKAEWIYMFAKDIKGADIPRLQDVVIKSGNTEWIYRFAQDVKGAGKKLLKKKYNELKNKKQASLIYSNYEKKREGQEKVKQFATSKNNPDLAIIIGDGYATEEGAQILAVNPDGTYRVRTTWSGRDMGAVDPIFFGEYPVTSFWKEKLQNENTRREKYHKGPVALMDNEYQKRTGSLIHTTWQRQIFAKKLLAGLVDRLQDSMQGEQVKSKEIADLVRQEFNLPANVVVPIKAIKQDPNFIINNYTKIMGLSQKDSKKTWEILIPNKKLEIEEDKSQLNADDSKYLIRIEGIVKQYPPTDRGGMQTIMEKFVGWVKGGYISSNRQSLNEVYDWYIDVGYAEVSNMSYDEAVNSSYEWHRIGTGGSSVEKVEEYRVGHLGDQTITVDGQSMKMVNIHSNVDLVEEGNKMGHCVGGENYWRDVESGEKEIYSLRDSTNEPHVTIDVRGNEVWQVYGKSDSRPNSEYMPFVRKWIEDNNLEVMGTKLNTYSWLEIVSNNDLWRSSEQYFLDNFGRIEGQSDKKEVSQYTKDERDALKIVENRLTAKTANDDEEGNLFFYGPLIYKVAKDIKGVNISKLQDAIIRSGNEHWIYRFAEGVNGANKKLLMKKYEELKNKKFASIYTTWQKQSKLSEEELKAAEEYAKKRPKSLTWGLLFQQERTYFPYTPKADKIQVPWNLESHLLRNGYQIVDYRQGLAQNARTGREIGIGKLLKDQPELLAIFVDRLQGGIKSQQPHFIVFTHKPEDIAGMSTDRGWTSCLTLRPEELKNYGAAGFMHGDEKQYVFSKIARGGMVAYLVREGDKEIEHPLGRIDLRRYENACGDFIFVWGDMTYGIHDQGFEDFVRGKIRESNSLTDKSEYEEFSDVEELELDPGMRQMDFPESMKPEDAKKYYEPTQTWEVSANMIYNTWRKRLALQPSQVYDFYALSTVMDQLDDEDKQVAYQILEEVKDEYVKNLTKAVYDEHMYFGYVGNRTGINNADELAKKLNISKEQADHILNGERDYIPLELAHRVFNELPWAYQYGGPRWAAITQYLIDLKNTSVTDHKKLMYIIDRINDIEHNTGSIFTKFEKGESRWIKDVLDKKYSAKTPYSYYDELSPDVKKIMKKYRGILPTERGYDVDYNKLFKTFKSGNFFDAIKGLLPEQINVLQNMVIKSGNAKWIYKFTFDVKGADKELLMKKYNELTKNK